MILPEDFEIAIGAADDGSTFVRVVHLPTGNERRRDNVPAGEVGTTRDALLAELRRLLYATEDIRFVTGKSEGGDFIAVHHRPSGIHRHALSRESTYELLLD